MPTFRITVGDAVWMRMASAYPEEKDIRNAPWRVKEWCKEHNLEYEFRLESWADIREGPSNVEFIFEDEAAAMFFKLVWILP